MQPTLEPGHVYRTRDFLAFGANAPRMARRLVERGDLIALTQGMFLAPLRSRFGPVPATDQALLRAFLGGDAFVFTGPEVWNSLGLGTTAVFSAPLVYNRKRSGFFQFGGRKLQLRRVAFPDSPPREWFVVDLFEHAASVGASKDELAKALVRRVREGAFDVAVLGAMVARFGSRSTRIAIAAAIAEAVR